MKYYIDENNNYGVVDGGPIPSGTINVSKRPDHKMVWNGSGWIWNIDSFKNQLYANTDIALKKVKEGYPELETETWDQQEKEARLYQEMSGEAHTPMIDAIIANSGENKEEFVGYIINKADTFASQAGAILGTKRALFTDLEQAEDPSTIDLYTPFQ